MMGDDIGVSDIASDLDAVRAEINRLRIARAETQLKLEDERARADKARARVKQLDEALTESSHLMLEAALTLTHASRREEQIKALASKWDEREKAFVSGTGPFEASFAALKPNPQESAAAATAMCANDLRSLLLCKNPDCPCNAADKAGESKASSKGENGDDKPSP